MKKNNAIRENKMRKDIINYLIDFPLFDAFKGNQLNIVAEHMNYYEIDKDEILFKEGDKGDYICFVLDGVIDVLKKICNRRKYCNFRFTKRAFFWRNVNS